MYNNHVVNSNNNYIQNEMPKDNESNDDNDNVITINNPYHNKYVGILYGDTINREYDKINTNVKAYSAEIYVSDGYDNVKALDIKIENNKKVEVKERVDIPNKPLEEMNIDELHQVILDKMAKNGNVTEYILSFLINDTNTINHPPA